jgi:hypothetical protein
MWTRAPTQARTGKELPQMFSVLIRGKTEAAGRVLELGSVSQATEHNADVLLDEHGMGVLVGRREVNCTLQFDQVMFEL